MFFKQSKLLLALSCLVITSYCVSFAQFASLTYTFEGQFPILRLVFNCIFVVVNILWASLVAELVKNACNAGDLGSILCWEDPLEKEYPLQYSGLVNFMDCTEIVI